MKKLKDVEETRKKYHKDPNLNSVHRSSLMVPEIPDAIAEISFLNHFLLKRNHKKIACVITGIDLDGKKIGSKLYHVEEPRVYRYTLTGMFDKPASNYMIEFYSVDNLFIPFPAVMVNHRNDKFINQVHSFNRVLNDIFENDDINTHQVSEASVDLIVNENTDTCLLFTAGPLGCKGSLSIEISNEDRIYKSTYQLNVPRFGTNRISIHKTFKDFPLGSSGVLKALQPPQLLFYGRLLAGQWKSDGAFSANHSYYDSSTVEEYWDNTLPSSRFYTFFEKLNNIVRIYPISSPSELDVFVNPTERGRRLKEIHVGILKNPSSNFLDININRLLADNRIDHSRVNTFEIIAKVRSGKMPTRIGHQLVYGAGGLDSSINMVLNNPNRFIPKDAKSFKWGQTVVGSGFDSFVGIIADPSMNQEISSHEAKVTFYDTKGKLAERIWNIKNGEAIRIEVEDELKKEFDTSSLDVPEYIWCTVEGENYGLDFCSVAYNKLTKHCSGDHGF